MTNLWCVPEDLGDQSDSEYAYEACKAASQLLWAMSGRKFQGLTTVTERYIEAKKGLSLEEIRADLTWDSSWPLIISYIEGWAEPRTKLRLRGYPVNSIESILDQDGATLDPSDYQIVEHSTIVFNPGPTRYFRDLSVTYSYGTGAPTLGKMAARQLAIQFSKLWSGDETCDLPERVTNVSRLGVSFTVLDNQDWIEDLRTGIYAVDLFLKSVNPDGARARARVFSPDIRQARRVGD